eukprot:scaffold1450_cov181-Ochromonas_danica.AAC.9
MNGISHLPDNIWLAYVLDPYYKGHMMGDEVKGSIVEKLRAMVAAIKQPVPIAATTTSTPTPTNPTTAVTKSKKRSALFRDMFVSLQEVDSSVD